jgi:hypothetical protein
MVSGFSQIDSFATLACHLDSPAQAFAAFSKVIFGRNREIYQ